MFKKQKMQEPFDARVSPLLDEALRPAQPPTDLADRIFAATRLPLARAADRPAVLAYIGSWCNVRSVAAAIVCAALLGIGMVTGAICQDVHDVVQGRDQIVALSAYRAPSTNIDQDIRTLRANLEGARASVEHTSLTSPVDPATVTWPEAKTSTEPGA